MSRSAQKGHLFQPSNPKGLGGQVAKYKKKNFSFAEICMKSIRSAQKSNLFQPSIWKGELAKMCLCTDLKIHAILWQNKKFFAIWLPTP